MLQSNKEFLEKLGRTPFIPLCGIKKYLCEWKNV